MNDTGTLLFWALLTGVLSALATGLGAFPVALIQDRAERAKAWASGIAAGMMVWAALQSIILEAWAYSPYLCGLGLASGLLFMYLLEHRLPDVEKLPSGRLLWLVMLIHSFPEGLAIGVGFATGDLGFGLLLALVISVHNIPEGLAISLAMRADGAGIAKCFWYSVYSSLPQPLVAVPAALFVSWAKPLIAPGLGFAGGAMLMVVGADLLPKTFSLLGRARTFVAVATGGALMGGLTYLLEQIHF